MKRDGCYGACPVYDLEIDTDGSVRFQGMRYVRVRGKQTSSIPAVDVASLVAGFHSARFFDLPWKDPCDGGVIPDQATVTLTLVDKGRTRTLVDYLGDSCIPRSLRTLADEVDRVARTDAWTKCEPPEPSVS